MRLFSLTKLVLTLIVFCGIQLNSYAQQQPEFLEYTNSKWVDSIMQDLTPNERIAQLIMVAAYSNRDLKHKEAILKLIKEQKIGGLIFFSGNGEKAGAVNERLSVSI